MRGTWLPVAVMLLVLATPVWAGDPDLRLELESNVRTLRLGQEGTLRLRIAGPGIRRLMENSEGISPKNSAGGAFVYELAFKPPREGDFTLGPYQLSFNDQKLTSNRVSLFVLPAWDGRYGTLFRTDSNSITLGESIEFVIETWTPTYEPKRCLLKRNEAFTSVPGETIMSSTVSDKSTRAYVRSVWFITPKQAGEFRITGDLFQNFPEKVEPPNITVIVREPDPPTGPGNKEP
jgi:hypothetical protein